ncbi:MAG: MATE family efflux transporter [Eubacteriaceae bacterium]|nr:MATE family efflux transporter [Eubacteriaceae bacterium]
MKKFIGDKAFYRTVFRLVVPMIIQSAITSLVSLVDNLMVGSLGTESIAAVAVTNQIFMVFNLLIFGGSSAAGIFTAQFFGNGDDEGVKNTFRWKLWFCTIAVTVGVTVFVTFDDQLISAFMTSSEGADIALAAKLAKQYMYIMLIGLIPFSFTNVYTSTMKECNKTFLPMISGVVAVLTNVVLNYTLIFGKFGAPALGVAGAAIATVISRFVEILIAAIGAHTSKDKGYDFTKGVFKKLSIPKELTFGVLKKGFPLICNEVFWSLGMTLINQAYSTRGLEAVAAFSIANTINNLFTMSFMTMGNAVAILVGQQLGSGDMEGAVDTDRKLIATGLMGSVVMGIALILAAPFIVQLYKTDPSTKEIATGIMTAAAFFFPLMSYTHCTYFTMRSGGKTFITFLFDSVFTCLVSFPTAYVLSRFTDLTMVQMYIAVEATSLIKAAIGTVLLVKRVWVNNIIS